MRRGPKQAFPDEQTRPVTTQRPRSQRHDSGRDTILHTLDGPKKFFLNNPKCWRGCGSTELLHFFRPCDSFAKQPLSCQVKILHSHDPNATPSYLSKTDPEGRARPVTERERWSGPKAPPLLVTGTRALACATSMRASSKMGTAAVASGGCAQGDREAGPVWLPRESPHTQ